jgi:hypothetical protein
MEGDILGWWLNVWWSNESSKEVSNEDLIRVSENAKKAVQAWMQTKASQQSNSHLAKFLEFLFSEIKSDEIREILVQLCTKPDSTWIWMMLALPELIAFVAPFFPHQMQEHGVYNIITGLPPISAMSKDAYLQYIHALNTSMPLIQAMDNDTLSLLALRLLEYFGYVDADAEKEKETLLEIKGVIQ